MSRSVRKKVDPRIKAIIENGIQLNHRSLFLLVGDRARDQAISFAGERNSVINLHHILSKARVGAMPSVLWCYKNELGFSTHRQKRMKQIKKKEKLGLIDPEDDDPFELFLTATQVRWCYYKDTHKVLGNTYGMLVLQDFEAITPNILARTIETVVGGGLVVVLLKTMQSLRQLYTMAMDAHKNLKTDVKARFNERFLLSLTACKNALVTDDELNVLPVSVAAREIEALPPAKAGVLTPAQQELQSLKSALQDTVPIGPLVNKAKTLDQARALVTFIEAISEKTLRSTVALTAARGRGKSAALGLAIAAAVGVGYSNIFVTSPSPENLKTLFEFIFIGFDAMSYVEHVDYELIQSTNPEFNNAVVRVNVFRSHRQVIQYIAPTDSQLVGQAELVVIDEAASIPLPYVKSLLGPYLVFMASTVNGYEGTGRSLSLKLIKELKEQAGTGAAAGGSIGGRALREITLADPIRYSGGDPIEDWLNRLLCLDATVVKPISSGAPHPDACELYYVNRDTLFSYHKVCEEFLQRMMALYVSSHYKNSPNDLMLMADAPAHHMFVLLPKIDEGDRSLPDIMCVVQVALEGQISKQSVADAASKGKKPSGDLIPWTISQQFQDDEFPSLSGARVVRIATHPDFTSMGYGKRALQLLGEYYAGRFSDFATGDQTTTASAPESDTAADLKSDRRLAPRKHLPPLLQQLSDRPCEHLHYLGVSYGLTPNLFNFWKKAGFLPLYLRLSEVASTGEHTTIMLKQIEGAFDLDDEAGRKNDWLLKFNDDFTRRFVNLCGFDFRKLPVSVALSIVSKQRTDGMPGNKALFGSRQSTKLSKRSLDAALTSYDLKRLESYSQNLIDYHAILDLLPTVSRLYFVDALSSELSLSLGQSCILMGLGLQYKSIDQVSADLSLQPNQVLALFNKAMRKMVKHFNEIESSQFESELPTLDPKLREKFQPLQQTLEADLNIMGEDMEEELRQKQNNLINSLAHPHFAVRGSDEDWKAEEAKASVRSKVPNLVSIKRKLSEIEEPERPKKKAKNDHDRSDKRKKDKKHHDKKHKRRD